MQFLHWTLGGGTLACIGTVLYAQELKGKENAKQKVTCASSTRLV